MDADTKRMEAIREREQRATKGPCAPWRVQSTDDGAFDELAVGRGASCWLHIEHLASHEGGDDYFIAIGGRREWWTVDAMGKATRTMVEGER